jgi:hypothetical protein
MMTLLNIATLNATRTLRAINGWHVVRQTLKGAGERRFVAYASAGLNTEGVMRIWGGFGSDFALGKGNAHTLNGGESALIAPNRNASDAYDGKACDSTNGTNGIASGIAVSNVHRMIQPVISSMLQAVRFLDGILLDSLPTGNISSSFNNVEYGLERAPVRCQSHHIARRKRKRLN